MANLDLHSNVFAVQAISSRQVSDNTVQVGDIIDTQEFYQVEFVTNIGTLLDAAATFSVLVEDGDDPALSDAAPVGVEFLIPTGQDATTTAGFAGATDSDSVRRIGYVGDKQFVRYTITPATNAAAADFGVSALLGTPRHGPSDENS